MTFENNELNNDRRTALPALKEYSEEEINAFLMGDRRVIDRLLLHGLNNLSIVLIAHAKREEEIFEGMGSPETIINRSKWIDSQIKVAEKRASMMEKVVSSSLIWAVLLFLGYLFSVGKLAFLTWFKSLKSS
jgi:hypothetical protein